MNNRYNSYFNLNIFKCIDNKDIYILESKINSFLIDNSYNYAVNFAEKINILPKININLNKIKEYYAKMINIDEKEIFKEIKTINYYVKKLLEFIKPDKIEGLREENIIFYLFQFMNQTFVYFFLNPILNSNQNINKDKINNIK